VRIAVEDNGVGFEIGPAQARGGRGLRNLHKRAGQLRAKMEIESAPGRTCIALHLPLVQAAA
jgi:signal transduction histidine kinase